MKKFLVGLLTVALAASMLVGCGKKEEKTKTDNSLKDVQSKKELVLGLDSSFPPMGFTEASFVEPFAAGAGCGRYFV